MGMIEQRIFGLALIIGAIGIFFVLYSSYWFSYGATTVGRVANIAIVVLFFAVGMFYLVRKDFKVQ